MRQKEPQVPSVLNRVDITSDKLGTIRKPNNLLQQITCLSPSTALSAPPLHCTLIVSTPLYNNARSSSEGKLHPTVRTRIDLKLQESCQENTKQRTAVFARPWEHFTCERHTDLLYCTVANRVVVNVVLIVVQHVQ